MNLEIHPVTPEKWPDFEKLFGKNGACDGCWCMWWRLKRSDYSRERGEGNKHAIRKIILRGDQPGLLAFLDGDPVGWCCVAPRSEFPVLERSPNLKPVDDQPVWSIVCLFVHRPNRRKGITSHLIKAAVQYAGKQGATIVEAYPMDKKGAASRAMEVFTGVPSTYRRLGFKEVLRRSPMRPIMRKKI